MQKPSSTSASDHSPASISGRWAAGGRLVTRLFSLAMLALPATALVVVIAAREGDGVARVVDDQAGGARFLVEFGDARQQAHFKLATLVRRRPAVITLGGSRCSQFRSGFLNRRPQAFYNACQLADTLGEARLLIQALGRGGDYRPEIILLSLDPWWFSDAYLEQQQQRFSLTELERGVPRGVALGGVFVRELAPISRRLLEGKLLSASEPRAIGLTARFLAVGTRQDGSYRYDYSLIPDVSRRADVALYRISRLSMPFNPASTPSTRALGELASLLEELKRLRVEVIPFVTPLSPRTFAVLRDSSQHRYLATLASALGRVSSEHGYRLRSYLDPSILVAAESDFIDGWHGSERLMLRLYIDLVRDNSSLGEFSDLGELLERSRAAAHPFKVFDD